MLVINTAGTLCEMAFCNMRFVLGKQAASATGQQGQVNQLVFGARLAVCMNTRLKHCCWVARFGIQRAYLYEFCDLMGLTSLAQPLRRSASVLCQSQRAMEAEIVRGALEGRLFWGASCFMTQAGLRRSSACFFGREGS